MPRTLTDDDVEAIVTRLTERGFVAPRRTSADEILTGEQAASRMKCCYNTFKIKYVKTKKIAPVSCEGRHGRGYTSASVEALRRATFCL